MNISITDAQIDLPELVRRAEAGEEIVLTRHGQAAATLRAIEKSARALTPAEIAERRRIMVEISDRAAARALPGPDGAHSADYLYGDDGLPV